MRHHKEVRKWKFTLIFSLRPGLGQEGLTFKPQVTLTKLLYLQSSYDKVRFLSRWPLSLTGLSLISHVNKSNIFTRIFLFKVYSGNTRTMCAICWKLIKKTQGRCQWRRSGVFIVNSEQILPGVWCFDCWLWKSKYQLGES